MNVLLLVVDSLRASSLGRAADGGPQTPFLDRLAQETTCFRQAYATECWTMPAHVSMFTGLLPSEHGAHFQGMAYRGVAPTVAELLAAAGHHTEVITRNPQFDGSVPGVTRGFRANTCLLAPLGAAQGPFALLFALQKPRLRRAVAEGGWYSLVQRQSRGFVSTMARIAIPSDQLVLAYLLDEMHRRRRAGESFFYFANLFDVHSPYPPSHSTFFSSFRSFDGWAENLALPQIWRIISHDYLREGFDLPDWIRHALLRRYHRAIERIDEKLAAFFADARRAGLFDDTLVILTSDHGEAFGEHGLYYHDASVYDTHLHVPLWIHHPGRSPAVRDDVVSTRGLFDLMTRVGLGQGVTGTLLDPSACDSRAVALAEHFHYAHRDDILPRYRQNIAAAIVGRHKLVVRGEGLALYDRLADPAELAPVETSLAGFEDACRSAGATSAAIAVAAEHVRRWEISARAA